jgi:hypothetical protein
LISLEDVCLALSVQDGGARVGTPAKNNDQGMVQDRSNLFDRDLHLEQSQGVYWLSSLGAEGELAGGTTGNVGVGLTCDGGGTGVLLTVKPGKFDAAA